MIKTRKIALFIIAISLLVFSVFLVKNPAIFEKLPAFHIRSETSNDLPQILERGVLRATTNFSSTNYFMYRGEPMGFHFELLQQFSEHLGVELEIFATGDLDQSINCLIAENECDILAVDFANTQPARAKFNLSMPHNQAKQVLVQRRPSNPSRNRQDHLGFVANQLDLAGKTVHVQRNTAYTDRLRNLMDESGISFTIVEMDTEVEQLIEMVSNGEIDYTVSFENIAKINRNYFSNIDISTALSLPQNLSWAVRKDAPQLLTALNLWLEQFMQTREYAALFNRYFNNSRSIFIAKSPFSSLGGGKISVFDHYFQRYAEAIGWDWRLIASLAYQESRFDPTAVSWAGAFGIMQMMPATAATYDVDSTSSVSEHVSAGVRYLRWIDNQLKAYISDDEERLKFVLASYNVGIGHVLDAIRLAEKHGRNPEVWEDNVAYFVLNKSKPKYYQDEVVRFGFARGIEPYRFVIEILERYTHFKNNTKN